MKPVILIEDKPKDNLDTKKGDSIFEVLNKLNEHGHLYAEKARSQFKLLDSVILQSPK
jgi:ABC-type ATPase involved in cell division